MSSSKARMDVGESQAYHIALKTLRERCHYLQHKLEAVEEENCKLKLQLSQDSSNKSPRTPPDVALLQEQIALLTKQKSQLSQQVQMVATENHSLWSRLSKLSAVNQNLGTRLSMITDTINRHESNLGLSINQFNLDSSKVDMKNSITPECSKESLEEISLKLINGILLEKTELENQYAQMVDLQNDNQPEDIENFCFSLSADDDGAVLNSIKKHVQKLNQFKELLYDQKNDLTSAIENLKNVQINKVCSNCVDNESNNSENVNRTLNINNSSGGERGNETRIEVGREVEVDNQVPDKICPMCGATFSGTFQEFHDHVTDHFGDDDEHESFEMLPQNLQ